MSEALTQPALAAMLGAAYPGSGPLAPQLALAMATRLRPALAPYLAGSTGLVDAVKAQRDAHEEEASAALEREHAERERIRALWIAERAYYLSTIEGLKARLGSMTSERDREMERVGELEEWIAAAEERAGKALEISMRCAASHEGRPNGDHDPVYCGRCAIDSMRHRLDPETPGYAKDDFPPPAAEADGEDSPEMKRWRQEYAEAVAMDLPAPQPPEVEPPPDWVHPGTTVWYHPVIGDEPRYAAVVDEEPRRLGGEWVATVRNVTAYGRTRIVAASVEALEPRGEECETCGGRGVWSCISNPERCTHGRGCEDGGHRPCPDCLDGLRPLEVHADLMAMRAEDKERDRREGYADPLAELVASQVQLGPEAAKILRAGIEDGSLLIQPPAPATGEDHGTSREEALDDVIGDEGMGPALRPEEVPWDGKGKWGEGANQDPAKPEGCGCPYVGASAQDCPGPDESPADEMKPCRCLCHDTGLSTLDPEQPPAPATGDIDEVLAGALWDYSPATCVDEDRGLSEDAARKYPGAWMDHLIAARSILVRLSRLGLLTPPTVAADGNGLVPLTVERLRVLLERAKFDPVYVEIICVQLAPHLTGTGVPAQPSPPADPALRDPRESMEATIAQLHSDRGKMLVFLRRVAFDAGRIFDEVTGLEQAKTTDGGAA